MLLVKRLAMLNEWGDMLGSGWATYPNGHVVPVDDLYEHILTVDCWCRPTNIYGVVVHNSKDCREMFEHDRLELNKSTKGSA